MRLEVGKTYRFEGTTHDTIYVVVSEIEGKPDHVQVMILESNTKPGWDGGYQSGELIELNRESKWALESEQFASPGEQGKVPT